MYYVVKKHFSIEHSQICHNSCFYCPWFKDNGEIERMKIVHLFLVQSLEHLCEEQVNDVCKEDIQVTMKILNTLTTQDDSQTSGVLSAKCKNYLQHKHRLSKLSQFPPTLIGADLSVAIFAKSKSTAQPRDRLYNPENAKFDNVWNMVTEDY